ncbi:DoxX family protein [Muriicola soli]|uniref:DoxX family protein n=1 Tax=Muriicola soli TaxID=2507538 RepID=A0A411ECX4_9FLAO|nr:DoxX family protein [Muriicola soli]QBA65383.1 DoxX family protein [Muriicola soli]
MDTIIQNAAVLLLLLFIIITFLQSGMDKVVDWKGNLAWLKGHFSKSPFRNVVPLLLVVITCMELIAGALSLIGFVQILNAESFFYAEAGAVIACLTLLMLLFGQRIAKDYEGAKTIVIYFIPAIILVVLLQLS